MRGAHDTAQWTIGFVAGFLCDDDWRQLPAESPFYLVFGVEDRTISLPSAIRWEALRDARERWPLPSDHTAFLHGPELTTLLG